MKPYYQDKRVTIYHGDCREILPTLPKVDLVLTDPPYGINAVYGDSYDDNATAYWEWFIPTLQQMRNAASVVILTHKVSALHHLTDWDWVGVWNKPWSSGARLGNSPVLPHWEPIFMYGIHTIGVKTEYIPDVLSYNPVPTGGRGGYMGREAWKKSKANGHPTPKPTELLTRLITAFSPADGFTLDPFLGSGTTCYCAKKLNRYSIGIEIEEKYCEIAARRCSQEVMDFGELSRPVEEIG